MRAAVLAQIPSMLEVADIEVDTPDPREVLLCTVDAGLCHSDLHFMEGKYGCDTPTVPGHEAVGVVEAVGRDVTHVQPGDHVIGCLSIFCGHCEYCLSDRPVLCTRQGLERDPELADPHMVNLDDPQATAEALLSLVEMEAALEPRRLTRQRCRPQQDPWLAPRRNAAPAKAGCTAHTPPSRAR